MKISVLELARDQKKWKKLLGQQVEILNIFTLNNRTLALICIEEKNLLMPIHSESRLKVGMKAKITLGVRGKTEQGVWMHGPILCEIRSET